MNKITKDIRIDFPIYDTNSKLVYLDSAAMSLKPRSMIAAEDDYYKRYTANVFRGIYKLSEEATRRYEASREKVAAFIGVKNPQEVIFVRNTTEAINLIAYSWGRLNIGKNDEIVTTIMEHHSNFLPWQQLVLENGAVLKILDINEEGVLMLENLEKIITKKTKLVTLVHVSNALGTINPIKEIIKRVKRINPQCLVLVDGAQSVPHTAVDVADLGCDFLAFSGQKMLGPTGAGVLWARKEILDRMPPFLFGGEMIREVYLDRAVFADIPHKFEAGTPHIAGVIGLGAAVDYLSRLGMDAVRHHEKELTSYTLKEFAKLKGVKVYGPANTNIRSGVITFTLDKVHPHDIAQIFDEDDICVRAGHHCAMPVHTRLGIAASVRATFYIYTTKEDVDRFITAILKVQRIFK